MWRLLSVGEQEGREDYMNSQQGGVPVLMECIYYSARSKVEYNKKGNARKGNKDEERE